VSVSADSGAPAAHSPARGEPASPRGDLGRLVAYLVLLVASIGYMVMALALPASRWEPLGSGSFPAIVLGVLIILSLLGVLQEVRGGVGRGQAIGTIIRAHRLVIFTFLSFVVCVLALPFVGFGVSTFVFLLVVQLGLAPGTWQARITAVVVAVVFSFGLVWFFAELFEIFLPRASLF
jgi:putative tricarboxylic transport membrane protein